MKNTFRFLGIAAFVAVIVFSMAACATQQENVGEQIGNAWEYFLSESFGYDYVPYSETSLTVTTEWNKNQCYVAFIDPDIVKKEVKRFVNSGWILSYNHEADKNVSAILFENNSSALFQFLLQDTITTVYRLDFAIEDQAPNYTNGLLWLLE